VHGRGRRGLGRASRREAQDRRELLRYLNE
jgi:hypothetical protein